MKTLKNVDECCTDIFIRIDSIWRVSNQRENHLVSECINKSAKIQWLLSINSVWHSKPLNNYVTCLKIDRNWLNVTCFACLIKCLLRACDQMIMDTALSTGMKVLFWRQIQLEINNGNAYKNRYHFAKWYKNMSNRVTICYKIQASVTTHI